MPHKETVTSLPSNDVGKCETLGHPHANFRSKIRLLTFKHADLLYLSINNSNNLIPILGIRNTCATSSCLSFPDASWEKVDNFVIVLIGLTRKQFDFMLKTTQ